MNKLLITMWVLDGMPDTWSYDPQLDAELREDLKIRIGQPSNYAIVMGVYPRDAKSQTYYFQLN